MLIVLATAATARSLYALPLLIPLSLLAGEAINNLPARVLRSASLVAALLFLLLSLLVWAVWITGVWQGHPPDVVILRDYLPREFPAALPIPGICPATPRSMSARHANSTSRSWVNSKAASACSTCSIKAMKSAMAAALASAQRNTGRAAPCMSASINCSKGDTPCKLYTKAGSPSNSAA